MLVDPEEGSKEGFFCSDAADVASVDVVVADVILSELASSGLWSDAETASLLSKLYGRNDYALSTLLNQFETYHDSLLEDTTFSKISFNIRFTS